MRLAIFRLVLVLGGVGAFAPAAGGEEGVAAGQPAEADFGGLPPGPGREAVYFTCRACHSEKQFTQQRLGRGEWDALLDTMVRKNGMEPPEPWVRILILNYLSTHFGVDTEDYAGLPPGPGREEVFYTCQACHSLMLVLQQRLSREDWDETLVWMVKEQDMPQPDPEERKIILDYLGTYLSDKTPR